MMFSGPKETFPPAKMWFSGLKVPPQLTELPPSAPKAASPFTGMWLSGLPDLFSLKNLFSSLHRFRLNPCGIVDAKLKHHGVGVDLVIGGQGRGVEESSFAGQFLERERVQRHGIVAEP